MGKRRKREDEVWREGKVHEILREIKMCEREHDERDDF